MSICPVCQACKCTNNTGRTEKDESFFKTTKPKNPSEHNNGFTIWLWDKI